MTIYFSMAALQRDVLFLCGLMASLYRKKSPCTYTIMNRSFFSLVHASSGACFLLFSFLFFMPRHYAKLSNKTKNKKKGKKHSVYVYEGIISNYCLLISVWFLWKFQVSCYSNELEIWKEVEVWLDRQSQLYCSCFVLLSCIRLRAWHE